MTDTTEQLLFSNEAFYLAFSQKDLQAMDGLWSRSASLVCVHPGWRRLTERTDIMASWQGILGNPEQPGMDFQEPVVHDYGPLQMVTCYEVLPGGVCMASNGFVREDGAWKLVFHHSSPCLEGGS